MIVDRAAARAAAIEIRDEVAQNANSANRVGGLLLNLVDSMAFDSEQTAVVYADALRDTNVASLSGLATVADGFTLATDGQVVFLTGQTNPAQNGPWVVHVGAWTRPENFAAGSSAGSKLVHVNRGTSYAETTWAVDTDPPTDIVDTDALTFTRITGQSLANVLLVANHSGTRSIVMGSGTDIDWDVNLRLRRNAASAPQNVLFADADSTTIYRAGASAIILGEINSIPYNAMPGAKLFVGLSTQYIASEPIGMVGSVCSSNSSRRGFSAWQTSADTVGARLNFFKSNNADFSTPAIVATDSGIGRIDAYGYGGDTAGYLRRAHIDFQVDGAPGATDSGIIPMRIAFATSDTNATPTNRMEVRSASVLLTTNIDLDWSDNARIRRNAATSAQNVLWGTATDTRLYCAGTEVMRLGTDVVTVPISRLFVGIDSTLVSTEPVGMVGSVSTSTSSRRGFSAWQHTADTVGGRLNFFKSAGASHAAPAIVTTDSGIARLDFYAWGGATTQFARRAHIDVQVDGAPGAADSGIIPMRIALATSSTNATPTNRLEVYSDKLVSLVSTVRYGTTVTSPTFTQEAATGTSNGQPLLVKPQSGGATSGNGGNLLLYGGDAQAAGNGGSVVIRAGLHVSGDGNAAAVEVQDAAGAAVFSISNFLSNGVLRFGGTGASDYFFRVDQNAINVARSVFFRSDVVPFIGQEILGTASGVGTKLTLKAQNCNGTTSTGGAIDIGPGSGTSAGGLGRLISGASAMRVSWGDTDTIVNAPSGSSVLHQVNGTSVVTVGASLVAFAQPISVTTSGATVAGAGVFRIANAAEGYGRNVGNTANLRIFGTDASDNVLIGDTANSAGLALNTGTGNINLRIGGTTYFTITSTALSAVVTTIGFASTVASGQINISSSAVVDATGVGFTVGGQSVTGSGTTITGGLTLIRGGDANSGTATNRIGGGVTIRGGTGTTGGTVTITTGGGTNRFRANDTGIGFYTATPIAQPSSAGETVGFTAGAGTAVNDASTFTGNVGATAYRLSDVVKHLKNLGLLAA